MASRLLVIKCAVRLFGSSIPPQLQRFCYICSFSAVKHERKSQKRHIERVGNLMSALDSILFRRPLSCR